MKFSTRVGASQPNLITLALRAATGPVTNLSDSNPTRHGLAPALLPTTYQADPRGSAQARQQLADFLSKRDGREVDPDRLYLLSSTSQGYAWLLKLFCDPGDYVLTPRPGYPMVDQLAMLEAVEVDNYFLSWDGAWLTDVGQLRQHLQTSTTSALVVINPNNPTGSYLRPDERAGMVQLCHDFSVPLIADEVFFDYALSNVFRERLAGEERVLTFALDGLSKNLAAPHAKVAWLEVSGPDELVRQAQEKLDQIADAYLPMSDLITAQLPSLLDAIGSQIETVRDRLRKNLQRLRSCVAASRTGVMDLYEPEGGWSALLRFPAWIDEDELVTSLIRDAAISAQPGYFFDMPTAGFLSISLLLQPEVMAAAAESVIARIDTAVEATLF